MQQNQFINFLAEFLQRLRTKKPKFFVYCQYFVAFLGSITGLPAVLTQLGITLSGQWGMFENKFVAACAAGFFLASQLTTASKVTATQDGTVLKATDADKLPFTAQKECEKATATGVPEVTTK